MNQHQRKLVKLATVLFVLWLVPAVIFAGKLPRKPLCGRNGAPGSEGKPAKELVAKSASGEISVWSIHQPSLTPYLPAEAKADRDSDAGHSWRWACVLAITHEGYNVAEWLSKRASRHFVLKHRSRARPTRLTRSKSRGVSRHEAGDALDSRAERRSGALTRRVGAIGFSRGANW